MLLWVVFAILTVIALLGAVLPLLRGTGDEHPRAEYDLQVYRHQLDELQNDLDRGAISTEEEAAARTEIERRILSTETADGQRLRTPSATSQIAGAIVAAVGIPALASGLYLYLGSPQSPDRPLADRPTAATTRPASVDDLQTAVSRLRARLARGSESLADWLLLGQSYTAMRRFDDAVAAYRQADGLQPDDPNIMAALGESLVLAAGGTVTPEAQAVFRSAHALDNRLPGPRFYMGLARAQAGDPREAYDIWLALANDSKPDAPWRPELIARLEEVGAELEKDTAAVLKDTPAGRTAGESVPVRGPTREDVEAAADMSAGDRAEMIRGMVAGLAERLEETPDDLRGWERLARSYEVLGEAEKAEEARRRAHALRSAAGRPPLRPARKGPAREDIARMEEMSPEDRSIMIQGMVEGLAARLEENSDDIQGWIMLARSYRVLNRPEKARDALRRAREAAPDDPGMLVQLGAAIVDAGDRDGPLPAEAVALFRRALDLDARNADAQYFVGMAHAQSGDIDSARKVWNRLLAQLDETSRAYATVRQQIESLATH
ncbi:MAG: c-type cytochrome biogenesis protein CcmI [Rhodospirillaceae bacterium]|nr:c-type cytochrome biogenesis protein CcmI [Rhodospirillaceae bacterium]